MRRFTPDEIRTFLRAVDGHLPADVTITIIGGSAAALTYSVTTGTVDVDTFESDLSAFEAELREARSETGLPVVIQRAAIADMPGTTRIVCGASSPSSGIFACSFPSATTSFSRRWFAATRATCSAS